MHFGHDPRLLQEASDLRKQADAGVTSYQEFLQRIADLSRVPAQKVQAAIESNVANDDLFAYIERDLKPHYKIGMLSNAAGDRCEALFGRERVKLFDAVALSYETGVTKPSKEAYLTIAERLGVAPEACIFVDDQERYCAAARDVGMQAIYYQDFDQFKAELEDMLRRSGK